MPLTIICPNLKCRSVLQVPESTRGKKVRCAKCASNFMVPLPTPANSPEPHKPEPQKAEPVSEQASP